MICRYAVKRITFSIGVISLSGSPIVVPLRIRGKIGMPPSPRRARRMPLPWLPVAELAQSRRELDDERALLLAAAAKSEAQANEEALQVMRVPAEEFQHRVDELSAEVDLGGATINALRLEITRLQVDRDALRRQLDAERTAFEVSARNRGPHRSSRDTLGPGGRPRTGSHQGCDRPRQSIREGVGGAHP